MAAVSTSTETVLLTINEVEIEVPKGELIVESVKRLGLEVPIFCYHSRLDPVGMCRMCLVAVGFKQQDGSVRFMPKPQTACTLPASEGMVVLTDSQQIHTDRKGVLEFLLINHPLDCPICDRGGECPLQNNTIFYGPSTSRYLEIKRHLPKAYPLSEHVTLDLERCIQCGRCVRFTEEISGDAQLAFRFRGAMMQPSTFQLGEFQSKFSGNTIEICPVGALTSTEYRFRARPWDLETKPAICTECSNGCNVWFDYRLGKQVRINGRTNEAVNEEWTCDRGKFGHDWYNENRCTKVLIREDDVLKESDWPTALAKILDSIPRKGDAAVLAGPRVSNEGMYLLQKLFREEFNSFHLDHRFTSHLPSRDQALEQTLGIDEAQASFSDLEAAKSALVFGTSLADESPMAFLRLRKGWRKSGARIIAATSAKTELEEFADLVLRFRAGTENTLAQGLLFAAVEAGMGKVPAPTLESIRKYTPSFVEKETGVPADALIEAAKSIGPGSVVVTSRSLLNAPEAQSLWETLGGWAMVAGAKLHCMALGANEQGALELGFLPDTLPGGKAAPAEKRGLNTWEILSGCRSGAIRALWLADIDLFEAVGDHELVREALEAVPFLVVQTINDNPCIPYASVVLPLAAPAEQDGTYVNVERRVQRLDRVIVAPGQARPAWLVCWELAMKISPRSPYFHADDVFAEIVRSVPTFAELSYDGLEGEGIRLATRGRVH